MDKWIERYFRVAKEVASWSKDPRRKIGAVIVGNKGQIKSQGYNGFPRGVNDDLERYNNKTVKHKYVCHAEVNCIYNALHNGVQVNGDIMFVTGLPGLPVCHECAKAIIQVGISHVLYDSPLRTESTWYESFMLALEMFDEAKVIHTFVNLSKN